MKAPRNFWRSLIGLVLIVALVVPLTVLVVTPFAKPLANQWAESRVAEWQRLQDRGVTCMKQQRYDEAEAAFKAALSYAETKLDMHPTRAGDSAFGLAGVYRAQERFAEARPLYEKEVRILEELGGKPTLSLALALNRAAEACIELDDFEAALEYAERQVVVQEALDRKGNRDVSAALRLLAAVYERQEDYASALPIRERISEIAMKSVRDKLRDLAIEYSMEGLAHHNLGDLAAAEPLYEKSLRILNDEDTTDPEWRFQVIDQYVRLLETTGRSGEAARLRASAEQPPKEGQQEPERP